MSFYLRFSAILIISILCFSFSVKAEQVTDDFSVSDFTMHRVTPDKIQNTVLNKNIPKTRSEIRPEQKIVKKQSDIPPENKSEEKPAVSVKEQKPEINNSVQTTSVPINHKILNSPGKNISDEEDKTANQDEIISKINKINETSKNLTVKNSESSGYKNSGNDFFKTLSSLSIVILLIFIFAWVYARVKGINPTAILTGKFSEKDLNRFNVLSSSTLGQGKDIHLVEINGKQLVIGSTANNINLLTEIAPEEIEKLKEKKKKLQTEKYTDSAELPEEDEFNIEPLEEDDFTDSDYYESTYSDVYKDYIDSKDEKTE